jgi:hypothetical protein
MESAHAYNLEMGALGACGNPEESAPADHTGSSVNKHRRRRGGQRHNVGSTFANQRSKGKHPASPIADQMGPNKKNTSTRSGSFPSAVDSTTFSIGQVCEQERKSAVASKLEMIEATAEQATMWGDIRTLEQDCERCNQIIAQIESTGSVARSVVLWLLPEIKALALSKYGCRVIQKAINYAGTIEQSLLVNELKGYFDVLYKSPWGNHVVMKIIEVLPPATLGFLLVELAGKAIPIARHQYGCRVFERLIEHFPAEQIAGLIDELLVEAEPLCRHPFGNFVMQHLFEHGTKACKEAIIQQIIGVFPKLAKHRTASHVVQRAIEFSDEKAQQELVLALINAEGEDSLVEIGCSRYGSFVVHELGSTQACSGSVCKIIQDAMPRLAKSPYGKRALAGFDLIRDCKESAAARHPTDTANEDER